MRGLLHGRFTVLGLAVVLALVAALALGLGPHTGSGGSTAVLSGKRTVNVHMADMRFHPSTITVTPGTHLVLHVVNEDQMTHDLHVALPHPQQTPLLAPGKSATLDLGTLTHTVQGWCTVPGHRAAGMTMQIVVTSAAAAAAPGHAHSTASASAPAAPPVPLSAKPGPDFKPYSPTLRPAPGGKDHHYTFTVRDVNTLVAPGVHQTLWTYNGTAPGPILHGHVGDVFTITLVNKGDMPHGIDFHAGDVPPDQVMRSIKPGHKLVYQFKAQYSGAWFYHCSTTPMSWHIANGMFGAVIIDPPGLDHVDKTLVLIQSEEYFGPQNGVASLSKIRAEKPDAVVFNGFPYRYVHDPITVGPHARLRIWVVDAGPNLSTSFHVVGAQFDTVFKEGAYLVKKGNPLHGAAQTLDLAPAQGGFVEFTLPGPGHYSFIDHAMINAERGARGVIIAK